MWSHEYDSILRNQPLKHFRIVLDLYTNEEYFLYNLSNTRFTDLIIKARNLNKELGFTSYNNNIQISLGELKNYPKVNKVEKCKSCLKCEVCDVGLEQKILPNPEGYHHIKLEISYTNYEPNFSKKSLALLRCRDYTSVSFLEGAFEKEFHVNIPNGMELDKKNLEISISREKKDKDSKKIKEELEPKEENVKTFKLSKDQIDCNKDALQNRYTLIVKDEKYSVFIKDGNYKYAVAIKYKVKHNWKYFSVNILVLFVFAMNFLNFWYKNNISEASLIALISIFALYFTLYREGTIFAYNRLMFGLMGISGLLFLISF